MSLFKNPQFTSRKLKDESYPPGTTAVWHVGRGKLADKNGFTLIELLGSLAIIAVLVTIIFTSMSSFRNSKALQTVSEDVLSLLDEAKITPCQPKITILMVCILNPQKWFFSARQHTPVWK